MAHDHDYEIMFLAVGQGDATLICNLAQKQAVLIDAAAHRPVISTLNNTIKLKAIFITHLDEDHIRGIPAILNLLMNQRASGVEVYWTRQVASTKAAGRLRRTLDEARADGTIITRMAYTEHPGSINLIGGTFIILWPSHDNDPQNRNLDSLVLRFDVASARCLFGGDATGIVWPKIASHIRNAIIFRFPHHGGSISTTGDCWSCDRLISEVDPSYVVVSASANNQHHPSREFLDAQKKHKHRNFRSTANGNIRLGLNSAKNIVKEL